MSYSNYLNTFSISFPWTSPWDINFWYQKKEEEELKKNSKHFPATLRISLKNRYDENRKMFEKYSSFSVHIIWPAIMLISASNFVLSVLTRNFVYCRKSSSQTQVLHWKSPDCSSNKPNYVKFNKKITTKKIKKSFLSCIMSLTFVKHFFAVLKVYNNWLFFISTVDSLERMRKSAFI